jgi:hypothetical protein
MKKKVRRQVLWEAAEYQLEDLKYRLKNADPEEKKSLKWGIRRLERAMTAEHEAKQAKQAPTPYIVGADGDNVVVAERTPDGGIRIVSESLAPMEGGLLTELCKQESKWPAPIPNGTHVRHESGEIIMEGRVVNTFRDRVLFREFDKENVHNVPRDSIRMGPIFGVPTVHWMVGDLVEWNWEHKTMFGLVQEVTVNHGIPSLNVLIPGHTDLLVWNTSYCRLLRRG